MILQYIQTNQINTADDSFRITFAPGLEELKDSIKNVGVINPITLRHTQDGTYQVVTGYKRLLACQELNRQTIPALIYEPHDLSPMQAFLYNLHDNTFTRTLNIVEKFNVCTKLIKTFAVTEEDVVRNYLPLMGEEPSYKILHQFLALQQLIEPMKQHVVENGFALSSANRIAEFTPATQGSLLDVLKHVSPSTSKLNELLTLIREIAARDGTSVEEILQRYQLLTIVADPAVAAPEKVQALRQTLRSVRLPHLTERQQQLTSLIQGLQLPQMAKLVADPYFEDPKLKLEYQFSAPEELNALVAKIQEAFDKQHWHKIFEWYRV
jgi:ParB/RepB/Spo0J family partition protein